MKIEYINKRNGQWFINNSATPFAGIRRLTNGKLYRYTLDGRRLLLTKPKPNAQKIIKNLWVFENPHRKGFRNGLYFPYLTANKNWDIGAGIDMNQQTASFRNEARKGFTPQRMNYELTKRANTQLEKTNEALKPYTTYPDTVSPQIKEGLADLRYQVGSLGGYSKLLQHVARGNIKGIQRESRVMFKNNNTNRMQYDKRRHQLRLDNYFHYRFGGNILPIPLQHHPNPLLRGMPPGMRIPLRRTPSKSNIVMC